MKKIPRISEAEWQVMLTLWRCHPISANQIVAALEPLVPWKPKTIKTLIGRLVKKEAVGFEKAGRSHMYYPLVEKEAVIRTESKSFLNRFFGGALTPMLASLIENEAVSREDIRELKKMLNSAVHTGEKE